MLVCCSCRSPSSVRPRSSRSGAATACPTPSPTERPAARCRAGDVDRAALDRLRFSLGFRGYRMDEVDAVLDRVAAELRAPDARIAELEARARPGNSRAPAQSG